MAVISCHSIHSPFLTLSSCAPRLRSTTLPSLNSPRAQLTSSSSMDEGRRKFMEFPYVSSPHRNLMIGLVSTVENRFENQLLPCTLPSDVQYFENQSGTASASLHVRSGLTSSPIDIMLGSWIHCDLPKGGALNITSLSTYLNKSTDSPNFVLELIQSSPTSLVLILDLPPRKDLVLHADYLQTFYEETHLDAKRQALEKLQEVQRYVSPNLFIRCSCSPTSTMIRVDSEGGGPARMEEIVKDHIEPIAKEVLSIWLDECAFVERNLDETEIAELGKRDSLFRRKTIEVDLGSSFPRLFGQEVTSRVLEAIREAFNV